MLLNLEYSLKCDAFIGTLASNTCRLMDELRATVGKYVCVCVCVCVWMCVCVSLYVFQDFAWASILKGDIVSESLTHRMNFNMNCCVRNCSDLFPLFLWLLLIFLFWIDCQITFHFSTRHSSSAVLHLPTLYCTLLHLSPLHTLPHQPTPLLTTPLHEFRSWFEQTGHWC